MTSSRFLADFHIHSRYSRATSRDLTLENLQKAALLKGITVVGTGDFTHPAWANEVREKLVPAEEGLFRLRDEPAREVEREVPSSCAARVRFILTAEISSIYKKGGRVRKVHNLLFAPSLDLAGEISGRLERIGNIASDGRPILGLDARELLGIVLEVSPLCFLVPAHIWTPWFSVLGSSSGFDSLEACFEDLTPEIFAVETGLSSDPAMNWRLSALDRFSLVSNSDAHSADKLGREANRFACELSFPGLKSALRGGREAGFLGTVEFFPEHGKYHYDGHRNCLCRLHPADTLKRESLCPVCGRKVTVGVMHRVELLADRPEGAKPPGALPYERLISLAEVVGDARGAGPETRGVRGVCGQMVQALGPELVILTEVPLDEIRREAGELTAEGIRRVRAGEVRVEAGYDGEFGVVRVFDPGEREKREGQVLLVGLRGGDGPEPAGTGGGRSRKAPKGRTARALPQAGCGAAPFLAAADGGPADTGKMTLAAGGDPDTGGPESGSALLFRVDDSELAEAESRAREATPASGAGLDAGGSPLVGGGAAESACASPSFFGEPEPRDTHGRAAESGSAPAACRDDSRPGAPAGVEGAVAAPPGNPVAAPDPLDGLNPEQRQAALFDGAPTLIIAGPGTGKTLTLTCRIACLVRKQGLAADRILALTFTQRAAREMEERLQALLEAGKRQAAVRVRTFHALGADILGEAGPARGIPAGFRIIGGEDQIRLLRKAAASISHRDAEGLLERISLAKRNLLYPENSASGRWDLDFLRHYRAYQGVLAEYRCLDYDDLVARTVRTLEQYPDFRQQLRDRLVSICVDEYQDVNEAQYRLLRLLAAPGMDLCVIGDPDQAIYGFRGASPRYFLEFERDYPGARVIRLVRNYRSTEPILTAATRMLGAPAGGQGRPVLEAVAGEGPRVREVEFSGEKGEAIFVAQAIESLMGGTDSLSLYAGKVADEGEHRCSSFADIAVLYRLRALAPVLEDALRHQGIPFQGASRADCWQGREGRTLAAVFSWLRDPEDRLAWETIEAGCPRAKAEMRASLSAFRERRAASGCSPKECVLGLPELAFLPLGEEPWREVYEALLRSATGFGRAEWEPFLRTLSLSRGPDLLDPRFEKVTLATLHAAKGLEFPVVFVVGCEDHLLPCRVGADLTDPGEERRLFYVGMTRARRLLFLTRSRSRLLYGERRECAPSCFLRDIPASTVEKLRLPKKPGKKGPRSVQPTLFKM